MTSPRRRHRSFRGLVAAACIGLLGWAAVGIGPAVALPLTATTSIVVKLDGDTGAVLADLVARFDLVVDDGGLASRQIFLVHSENLRYADPKKADKLARELAHELAAVPGVEYAEADLTLGLVDARFHGWPYGSPDIIGSDRLAWSEQPLVTTLGLAEAHRRSTGAGVTVAVLDSGADPAHPALAGRLLPGWDYVDDDGNPDDVGDGRDEDGDGIIDGGTGHGTFVSGEIALVAPDAKILPYRVLDGDGYGTFFSITQAVLDAVGSGADVINLSFGTERKLKSHLLDDAIKVATQRGVIVVGAAGNNGSSRPCYPAATKEVLGVSALDSTEQQLASYSGWGKWADVAAPGDDIVGPLPGGHYGVWSGTSMAAPLVAGQAALLLAQNPRSTADRVISVIGETATPMKKSVRDGSVNISASLDYLRVHP